MNEIRDIKVIRKKLGLTQFELAKKANVSQSLIAKIEAGRLDPTYSNAKKIFSVLQDMGSKKEIKARDLMQTTVMGVSPNLSIKDAVKKMKSHGYSQLPVIEDNKAIGMITEANILDAIITGSGKIVEDIMHAAPPVVHETTTIGVLSNLLKFFQMVLVSKRGKLVGIVTKSDILEKLYST